MWHLVVIVTMLAAPPMASTEFSAISESDLGLLLQQNDLSRSRIEAIDYTFHFVSRTYFSAMGPMHSEGNGHIIMDHEARWNELHRTTHAEREGKPITDESLSRWVLNDRYFALWRGGVSSIQMFDRSRNDTLPDHARMMLQGERGPNILLYGFGTGDVPLRDFVNPQALEWKWTAAKVRAEDGTTKFELRCFAAGRPKTPVAIIGLDPYQGFLVTRVTIYADDGTVGLVRDITNERFAGDVWLTKRVTERRFLSMLGAKDRATAANLESGTLPVREEGVLVQESSFEIDSVTLCRNVASSTFQVVSLQAPEHQPVARVGIDNVARLYTIADGMPVPAQTAQSDRNSVPD